MASKADLEKKILGLEENVLKLEAEVSILTNSNEGLAEELTKIAKQAKQTPKEPEVAKPKAAKSIPVNLKTDYVVLDGVKHDIVRDDTAKEIIDAVRKRYIQEDQTVVVINRTGSNR